MRSHRTADPGRRGEKVIVAAEKIGSRVKLVRKRIKVAGMSCGRDPDSITLVGASKTVPVDRLLAAVAAGVTCFGENYVQEAGEKIEAVGRDLVSWHFIGHLQTNKAKYAVKLFDLIHSVDSIKLAGEIDKRARNIGKVQRILIQVNISGEETKSGIDMEQALDLVHKTARLENLAVSGLMTMPPYFNAPERVRPYFRALKSLQQLIISKEIPNVSMTELSMGMTGDFETAIEEGATLVRVGTAIFGQRE